MYFAGAGVGVGVIVGEAVAVGVSVAVGVIVGGMGVGVGGMGVPVGGTGVGLGVAGLQALVDSTRASIKTAIRVTVRLFFMINLLSPILETALEKILFIRPDWDVSAIPRKSAPPVLGGLKSSIQNGCQG